MKNRLKSYSIERIGRDKNQAIWGQFENYITKMCILQKPKWISDEKFNELVKHIRIEGLTEDFFEEE